MTSPGPTPTWACTEAHPRGFTISRYATGEQVSACLFNSVYFRNHPGGKKQQRVENHVVRVTHRRVKVRRARPRGPSDSCLHRITAVVIFTPGAACRVGTFSSECCVRINRAEGCRLGLLRISVTKTMKNKHSDNNREQNPTRNLYLLTGERGAARNTLLRYSEGVT